jgi:gamma-glutamylputrescine oxidase
MADTDYPASWYAATRDSSPHRAPLSGRTEADVAVVGGGFAGLHTARLLAMRGRRVVLVERRRIGWGASGRNGGFVGAGFAARSGALVDKLGPDHARKLYAQSQRGVAIVRAALDELSRPDIRMGSGKLTVSRTDQGASFADRTRALAVKLGASFEPWDTPRVRALIDSERYHQAIHDPQAFHIHPLNLALALAGDIERRGGAVHERTEATGLERQGAAWRLRLSGGELGGEIAAPHVVLAGNADLGRVQPRIARAVLPVATYVAVTAKIGPRLAKAIRWRGAISDTRRAGDYYRIVDGDRLLWGGRITTDTREPPRLRQLMRADILSVYPKLGDVWIDYAWPGIMGYAPHLMPQVGEIEPGLWVCSAFGGHGLAQTAAGADAVAAGILGEDDRWTLFKPFGTGWAGGPLGRLATQLVYWKLQASDWWDEKRQAENAETLRT